MKMKLSSVVLLGCLWGSTISTLPAATGVWDGSESGTWTDDDNWESGTAPVAGDSLQFGAATNYTITAAPSLTFNGISFTNASAQDYRLAGDATLSGNATVEQSSASDHSIGLTYSMTGATVDVQGTTALTLSSMYFGGGSSSFTKTGAGTLNFGSDATDVGLINLNAGSIVTSFNLGQGSETGDNNFRLGGTTSSANLETFGTVYFGGAGSDGSSASFAGSLTGEGNVQFGVDSGNIDGDGVTQTFTSTSAHTYGGTTQINSGTMILNGTHTGGNDYSVEANEFGDGATRDHCAV